MEIGIAETLLFLGVTDQRLSELDRLMGAGCVRLILDTAEGYGRLGWEMIVDEVMKWICGVLVIARLDRESSWGCFCCRVRLIV